MPMILVLQMRSVGATQELLKQLPGLGKVRGLPVFFGGQAPSSRMPSLEITWPGEPQPFVASEMKTTEVGPASRTSWWKHLREALSATGWERNKRFGVLASSSSYTGGAQTFPEAKIKNQLSVITCIASTLVFLGCLLWIRRPCISS